MRSTQLASSTFDFFSIFFASGLLYLVLTSAVSVIQLVIEWRLDLDRATRPRKLSDYLPWRRVDLAAGLALPDNGGAGSRCGAGACGHRRCRHRPAKAAPSAPP